MSMSEQDRLTFVRPKDTKVLRGADPLRAATVVLEPLERGYGLTLGNSLRRVLLSSLEGAAVTAVHIQDVQHEFSTIPGVREDVEDLTLNIKLIALQMHENRDRRLELRVKGPATVTAGMIEGVADIKIVNPDLVLCHLDKEATLNMTLFVSKGRGYVSAKENRPEKAPAGTIPVDAIYSPIRSVAPRVQNPRVGQGPDSDSLALEVKTDGTISPEDAVEQAAQLLTEQLSILIRARDPADVRERIMPEDAALNPNLFRRVDELELSVRSANCLKNDNVVYVGDLVRFTQDDMLKTPNFGRKSLEEITEILKPMGLTFGMDIPGWPPENIEKVAKEYAESY